MFLTLAQVECRQLHAPATLLLTTEAVSGSLRQSGCVGETRVRLKLGYVLELHNNSFYYILM
jgi:hypothetical protein